MTCGVLDLMAIARTMLVISVEVTKRYLKSSINLEQILCLEINCLFVNSQLALFADKVDSLVT